MLLYLLVQNHFIFNSRASSCISIILPTFLVFARFSLFTFFVNLSLIVTLVIHLLSLSYANFRVSLALRRDRDTTKKTGFTYGSDNGW